MSRAEFLELLSAIIQLNTNSKCILCSDSCKCVFGGGLDRCSMTQSVMLRLNCLRYGISYYCSAVPVACC